MWNEFLWFTMSGVYCFKKRVKLSMIELKMYVDSFVE